MRKKYTDETYLKGVSKCRITKQKFDGQNSYVVVKEILDIDEPFIKNIKLIDNGFYIVEYTPLDKYYNARAFIDQQLNTVSYYFDISLGNGVDNGKPYYDDLYLDIVCGDDTKNEPRILDEDELLEALNCNCITQEQYNLANRVCKELFEEIQNGNNSFINMNKRELIRDMQKNR